LVEIRKIQQVGRSTLAVAIPKKWAVDAKLNPGTQVIVDNEGNGIFRIRTKASDKKVFSRCIINSDKCNSPFMLQRTIASIYLTGKETIEVQSKTELKSSHLTQIRDAVESLTGLGIIEQKSNQVIIQDFLDPGKFPFSNLIKHIFQIIAFMQDTLLKNIDEGGKELASEILNLEDELDRLYRLTIRQLLLVLRNSSLCEKIGISSLSDASLNYLIVKCLEDIADHYSDISLTLVEAFDKGLKKTDSSSKDIVKYLKQLQTLSSDTLDSLFSHNSNVANHLINEVKDLNQKINASIEKLFEKESHDKFSVNINTILWNLREIARQNRGILETIMNQCVETNKEVCNTVVNTARESPSIRA
jgi:phosphate uptake regulator